VGIAVYCKNGATAESTGAALDDDEAHYIYGEKDRCQIYTGEISYVGDHHIEYDVNAFGGCSGAIVFLLDMNQPTTVNQRITEKRLLCMLALALLWLRTSGSSCKDRRRARVDTKEGYSIWVVADSSKRHRE
jgi:hypothetical protein